MTRIFKLVIFVIALIVPSLVFAMSSTSFSVPSDVLNQAGGQSTSSSYKLIHSMGESVVGYSSSTSFQADQGFIQPDEMEKTISFSITPNSINFGSLSHLSVATGSVTLSTSTSASDGYSIQAYDDTPVGIAYGMIDGSKSIADATTPNTFIALPSAGTEHYGIVVTGAHADAGYASGTKINSLNNTTWGNIASHNAPIDNDDQTVQFRSSITLTTPAGTYHTITTFICTGNF